ncbi:MAG: hypothetical protein COT73_03710 [Bdellovibrio sp. CG10_big_fil_rev_8_21_14_0_10_47_8]|nr:MAG: hypothetical protein COT73_03710 [Bdellovibrio sp. CG10_big_fil_rev_8_21_14_0_10_47_8]
MEQAWKKINEILWECSYKFSSGISRSLLVKINENKFLVYSPGDKRTADLAKDIVPEGSELFLLAPNSYHNLGLAVWKASFPNSKPVAAVAAMGRLEKKTGIRSENLDVLESQLPKHISLIELPYNKIGEVWLDIQVPGERIWTVCDAIFNFSTLPGGFMGFLMKLNRMGPGIEMSRMYQYLGTSNKNGYGQWLLNEIREKKPTRLIPLHGEIYQSDDLIEKLETLAKSRLLNFAD